MSSVVRRWNHQRTHQGHLQQRCRRRRHLYPLPIDAAGLRDQIRQPCMSGCPRAEQVLTSPFRRPRPESRWRFELEPVGRLQAAQEPSFQESGPRVTSASPPELPSARDGLLNRGGIQFIHGIQVSDALRNRPGALGRAPVDLVGREPRHCFGCPGELSVDAGLKAHACAGLRFPASMPSS